MHTKIKTISSHLITALVNCEFDGLTSEENEQLDAFLESNNLGHCYCPSDFKTDFTRCQVTGLYSDCLDVEFEINQTEQGHQHA